MYVALDEKGRWAVIKALRKGIPPSPADASARPQSR
jgi:hypothetical protein